MKVLTTPPQLVHKQGLNIQMKIFLSWSGKRSRAVAEALNEWIPQIIQAVEPWMSPDIEKGKRWSSEISGQLEECRVGVICLTKENLESPWLCFEAGALSKTGDAFTCTLLLDVKPSDVQPPLGTFQHTVVEKEDIRKLFHTINHAVRQHGATALVDDRLDKVFDRFWPDMESVLADIANLPVTTTVVSERPEREILDEILEIVRARQREGDKESFLGKVLETSKTSLEFFRLERNMLRMQIPVLKTAVEIYERGLENSSDAERVSGLLTLIKNKKELRRLSERLTDLEQVVPSTWSAESEPVFGTPRALPDEGDS